MAPCAWRSCRPSAARATVIRRRRCGARPSCVCCGDWLSPARWLWCSRICIGPSGHPCGHRVSQRQHLVRAAAVRGDVPERAAIRCAGPGPPRAWAAQRDSCVAGPAGRRTCRRHGAGVHAGGGRRRVTQVQRAAEGVPFLVEEVLASPGVPSSFADTVRVRLGYLGDDELRVLQLAAVLGRHFDWRLLPAATGLAASLVTAALERGVGCQLLTVQGEEFRFRHALTRDAMAGGCCHPREPRSPAARSRPSRRLTQSCAAHGAIWRRTGRPVR